MDYFTTMPPSKWSLVKVCPEFPCHFFSLAHTIIHRLTDLTAERKTHTFRYIIFQTRKVAIGPLEYCGNARVIHKRHTYSCVFFDTVLNICINFVFLVSLFVVLIRLSILSLLLENFEGCTAEVLDSAVEVIVIELSPKARDFLQTVVLEVVLEVSQGSDGDLRKRRRWVCNGRRSGGDT